LERKEQRTKNKDQRTKSKELLIFRTDFLSHLLIGLCLLLLVSSCINKPERESGYLYLRLSTNPTSLDPALIVDVTGGGIGAKLFNGLVRLDADLKIIPDIARKWDISEDGEKYTFYLKKGIRFSNGREVSASDFKYSFERLLSPHTRSPNTWVLDRIKGADDFMAGRTDSISGIRIIDEETIEIVLEGPFSPFLSLLTMTAAYVVPREDVEKWGADFSTHPSGTGPFMLEEWKHNQYLKLQSRAGYFGGRPDIRGIIYNIIPEDLTAVVEFETGNLDIIEIPVSEFKRYRESPQWKGLVSSAPGISTYYLGFNCERKPFNDPLLRKAVSHAIDRKKILKTIYEGRGSLASGPVPPALRQWLPGETIKFDPETAKALMKKAGYGQGLDIKIYLTSDQEVLDILEVIQGYLANVGIKAELRQLEWSAYKEAINRGEPDAFWLSWWADYPDPENFLFPLFHSSNFGAGGNRTRYKDPEVDTLIENGQKSIDPKIRNEYYQRAEERIVKGMPWVFFWHRTEFTVRQPWVKNYKIYPIYSIDKGMDVSIK
jgi:peptide/nickel transport system substrate-binding protein/oligopeptide transport system substrate-binding protein